MTACLGDGVLEQWLEQGTLSEVCDTPANHSRLKMSMIT